MPTAPLTAADCQLTIIPPEAAGPSPAPRVDHHGTRAPIGAMPASQDSLTRTAATEPRFDNHGKTSHVVQSFPEDVWRQIVGFLNEKERSAIFSVSSGFRRWCREADIEELDKAKCSKACQAMLGSLDLKQSDVDGWARAVTFLASRYLYLDLSQTRIPQEAILQGVLNGTRWAVLKLSAYPHWDFTPDFLLQIEKGLLASGRTASLELELARCELWMPEGPGLVVTSLTLDLNGLDTWKGQESVVAFLQSRNSLQRFTFIGGDAPDPYEFLAMGGHQLNTLECYDTPQNPAAFLQFLASQKRLHTLALVNLTVSAELRIADIVQHAAHLQSLSLRQVIFKEGAASGAAAAFANSDLAFVGFSRYASIDDEDWDLDGLQDFGKGLRAARCLSVLSFEDYPGVDEYDLLLMRAFTGNKMARKVRYLGSECRDITEIDLRMNTERILIGWDVVEFKASKSD